MNIGFLSKYITKKIILVFCFAVAICLMLAEMVGISFEQMRLIANHQISINTSALIHLLAVPKFLLMIMPYALLMANMVTYKELSRSSEIVALCSFGISINRILMPSVILSILIANIAFCFQELVVTESNYQTATTLEKAMHINRSITNIKDFTYSQINDSQKGKNVNLLLHAKKASSKVMEDLILLSFEQGNLQKIMIAQVAIWRPQEEVWRLYKVTEEQVGKVKNIVLNKSEIYDLKLGHTINQLLTSNRDDDELNIFQLSARLKIFKETGHEKEVKQLEKNIQGRFITPFSCIVFSLIGASIGLSLKPKSTKNEFSLGLIIILIYYILQVIDSALIGQGFLPAEGAWVPLLFGLIFVSLRLFNLR
jgi:lipopolysaccharide export system permease protein